MFLFLFDLLCANALRRWLGTLAWTKFLRLFIKRLGTKWHRSDLELALFEVPVREPINHSNHVEFGEFAVFVPLQSGFSLH